VPWPTPDDSNEPTLWERQHGALTVEWLRRALGEAPDDATVVVGFYDGRSTVIVETVDVTMETSDQGAVRVVVTGAGLAAEASP
jgi:hypothetical protein